MKIVRLEELLKLKQENILLRKEAKAYKVEIKDLTKENKLLRNRLKLSNDSMWA